MARRTSALKIDHLDQRRLDLLGLGIVALGVFSAFVVYLGWDGGQMGEGLIEGFAWLLGAVHWLLPLALVAGGALVVLRPVIPTMRPFRAGALCLFLALTLGLAAGTLDLGPDGARTGWWQADFVRPRGGMVGEALFWLLSTLLGRIGAHIVCLFLLSAGVLLLTGASVASVLKATGRGVSTSARRVRESTVEFRASRRVAVSPPEPEDEEPRVTRTRSRTKADSQEFWSGEERYPDFYEEVTGEIIDAEPVGFEPEPDPEPDPVAHKPEPAPVASDDEDEDELPSLADDADEEGVTRARGPAEPVSPDQLTPQGRYRSDVVDSPDFVWTLPDPRRLTRSSADQLRPDTAGQEQVAAQLIEALGHFGVQAQVTGRVAGPHITRYEIQLAPGIKVGKVAQLKDDLAYALAAADIRILAPIPGKRAVGIEVPNARRKVVHLGDVFQAPPEGSSPISVWLGKDVAGRAICADLTKMPHLLVAGTTGAGKSGCINAMLCSVLLQADPHQVRMVLVDPKQVELNHYESLPHLLTPVITSPRKAATALQNLVREMESRYGQMALARARKLEELNKIRATRDQAPLPYILCVIDELADLMMVAPADVEDSIIRLAQKARAVGIHLVLATQSPRVDVITGMIKANVPSRIAFAVSSQTDSRVILDQNGAETLLGMGDMLFSPVGSSRLQRIQGAYIDEEQIAELTEAWRRQGEPEFQEELLEEVEEEADPGDAGADDGFDPDEDPLLEEAISLVASMQTASTSMLQRRLRLGYTRAGRLIDMLERRGIISGYEGSKPRQVLVTEADLPRVLAALHAREGALDEVSTEEEPATAE